MIDALKATWDHLPKRPRLPPSLFSLKTRKAWLNVKPTFTYGDERDKIQRENDRKAKKQLARDEAWALHEKKRKQREREREKKRAEREAKREELKKAKAAQVKSKPVRAATTPTTTKAMPPKVRIPVRSATAPARARSPQSTRPRVVYTVPAPKANGRPVVVQTAQRSRTVPQPRRQATVPVMPRKVAVQPWGPITSATQRPGAPPVVRSQTYPPRRK